MSKKQREVREVDTNSVAEVLKALRDSVEATNPTPSRAKSLALTKLDEFELWIGQAPNITGE